MRLRLEIRLTHWSSVASLVIPLGMLANCSSNGSNPTPPPPVSKKQYAYVTNSLDYTISEYVIGTDGSLNPLAPPLATGSAAPVFMAVDPSGHFAYVANNENSISQYMIGTDGVLTPMAVPKIKTVDGADPVQIVIEPSGHFAYVISGPGRDTIQQLAIGPTGALSYLNPATVATGPFGPRFLAIDPSGSYLFATIYNVVEWHAIGANGALSSMPVGNLLTAYVSGEIAIDPTGGYAYVTAFFSPAPPLGGTVAQYTLDSNGTLTPEAAPIVTTGSGPSSITIDPTGKYAYIADLDESAISQYLVATGTLEGLNPPKIPTGGQPTSIALDRTGHYAYVVSHSGNAVWQYSITANGTLTPISPATVVTGSGPDNIAITP
jgi:6-phosphogluconolactonase